MAKNLLAKDPGLQFIKKDRRDRLIDYYSIEPRALPNKEVKPLKYSKIDRFANTLEIKF
jgi:hypothetical protein